MAEVSARAWWRCQLDSHRSIDPSLTSKRRSFYYLFGVLLFLSPLCPALVGLHFALQLLIWFEIVEANHLITARSGTLLLRKPIGAKHLSNSLG